MKRRRQQCLFMSKETDATSHRLEDAITETPLTNQITILRGNIAALKSEISQLSVMPQLERKPELKVR